MVQSGPSSKCTVIKCCCFEEFERNQKVMPSSSSFILSILAEKYCCEKITKLPIATVPYLNVEYIDDIENSELQTTSQSFPFQSSALLQAELLKREKITGCGARKDKYLAEFKINATDLEIEPGSSFYFLCPNNKSEVDWLLSRLELQDKCDKTVELMLSSKNTKKNAKVPSHLPKISTYRKIFTHHVDIRRIMSKSFLRVLADCCSKCDERDALLLLCSSSELMDKFIRIPNLSLCDLLHHFSSCNPPVERLLEFLPRLLPRALSVAKCSKNGALEFVYSLVHVTSSDGRVFCRKGLCTGYLTDAPPNERMLVYFKTATKFRFSTDIHHKPIILVALGTGIAPFMHLLESISNSETSSSIERYLFFGCRHPEQDHIFRKEINEYVERGVLKQAFVAYSAADEHGMSKQHVQDKLEEAGAELLPLLLGRSTIIGICGVNLAASKSIKDTFMKLIADNSGIDATHALDIISRFEREDRYREEIWS